MNYGVTVDIHALMRCARKDKELTELLIEGLLSGSERPRFPDLSLGRSTFKQAQREEKEVKQRGCFEL
jgi:hypothetical protein